VTVGSLISLRIDRGRPPDWELDLRGRWTPTADDTLQSEVTGTLHGPDRSEPATGTITFWPRRFAGMVVGPRRIALDIAFDAGRLVLDAEVEPPPYLAGITRLARLHGADGEQDVKVWIAPTQLLELWFRLNLLTGPAVGPSVPPTTS
jgi:hypothetical protein